MASPELNVNLLSKSSPSQLPAFQFKRSRTQPIPTEAFYSSQQKAANSKPSNLSHVPCKFYKQGTCTAGANCTFSHSSDLSSESAVCKYFVKGNCKFGTKCALLHTMSPYGMDRKARPTQVPQVATPPVPQLPASLAATGRRKTDQVYSTSSEHRLFLDSFGGSDPFATSAPSFSLLRQLDDQQQASLWRSNTPSSNTLSTTPRTSLPSNDFIGLHPSPRESSDHLLGSSPFSNRQQQQYPISSSLRSNASNGFYQNGSGGGVGGSSSLLGGVNASGLADSHLGYSINRSQQHSMMMNNEDSNNNNGSSSNNNNYIDINNGNNSYQNHLAGSHSNNNSHTNGGGNYDLNDAMLPSSLNDLFTPSELYVRRVRQQEQYPLSYSPSRESNMLPVLSDSLPNWSSSSVDVAHYSTLDNMQKQQWRVPFLHKSQQLQQQLQQQQQQQQQQQYDLASDYEDLLVEGTAAINIPGGKSINNINSSNSNNNSNNNSGSGSTSSHYLQQQQDDLHHLLHTPAAAAAAAVAQDDEVQFFMEDDEAVTYDTNDHKITENSMTKNKTSSTTYPFPSFATLPTSSTS